MDSGQSDAKPADRPTELRALKTETPNCHALEVLDGTPHMRNASFFLGQQLPLNRKADSAPMIALTHRLGPNAMERSIPTLGGVRPDYLMIEGLRIEQVVISEAAIMTT
jgi:hypothetical protein